MLRINLTAYGPRAFHGVLCSDAVEAKRKCGPSLLLIVRDEDQVGLKSLTKCARGRNMNRVKRVDDSRHWSRRPFYQGSAQSDSINDSFEPSKLSSRKSNIVIAPVVFQSHSIDETAALHADKCAGIRLVPPSPFLPYIFLTSKYAKYHAGINVAGHERSARISASMRSTSISFSRFSGFIFRASEGGSIASSTIKSSSGNCFMGD